MTRDNSRSAQIEDHINRWVVPIMLGIIAFLIAQGWDNVKDTLKTMSGQINQVEGTLVEMSRKQAANGAVLETHTEQIGRLIDRVAPAPKLDR